MQNQASLDLMKLRILQSDCLMSSFRFCRYKDVCEDVDEILQARMALDNDWQSLLNELKKMQQGLDEVWATLQNEAQP